MVKLVVAAVDLALINGAFLVAYYLRYGMGLGGAVEEQYFVDLAEYLPLQVLISVSLLVAYATAGLYRAPLRTPFLGEAGRVLSATSVGMMISLALVYLYQGFSYSRGLLVFAWVLTIGLLIVARSVKGAIVMALRRRGIGTRRVIVVGGGPLGHMVLHIMATEPTLGYEPVGYILDGQPPVASRFRPLGEIGDLPNLLNEHRIDEVVIALPSDQRRLATQAMRWCERRGVTFRIVPDLYDFSLARVSTDELRGLPLVGVKTGAVGTRNRLLKRAFDLTLGVPALMALSPLMAAIAIAIKLDSPGPVIFKQERVGRGGRHFTAYKFRSMRVGAEAELAELSELNEATGPLFKMRRDPRVTRVGGWLRRSSLDELPQLGNVVRGEMSLVGPRPPIPAEVEQYEPWQRHRLEVRPGLTGLWQVSGRSELPFDEMVLLDIYYIENWSLAMDFVIMLRTLPAVVSGHGAF